VTQRRDFEVGTPVLYSGGSALNLSPVTGYRELDEHNNEPSGSIKGGEYLDWLGDLLASQEGLCSM
jgi:hypothetical protein